MHRNFTWCYRSITLQKQTQKKRSDLWLPVVGWERGGLNEGSQKLQASNYKIKSNRDVMYKHD